MALSFVEYQGDGITKVFAVPFDYIYRDDVKVTLNGQPATFSWLSPNSISLSTAPTSAQLLKIERDTEKQTALVDFKNDSVLDEALLDLMWKQVFMIIQEAQDQSDVSWGISDQARAVAEEALTIASSADSKSDTANVLANQAVSTSNTAVDIANNATATALSASSTASAASNTANRAETNANIAVTTAGQASETANLASSRATTALNTANAALDTANEAAANATKAVTDSAKAVLDSTQALDFGSAAYTAAADALAQVESAVSGSVVAFNGRVGSVRPAYGDYDSELISRGEESLESTLVSLEARAGSLEEHIDTSVQRLLIDVAELEQTVAGVTQLLDSSYQELTDTVAVLLGSKLDVDGTAVSAVRLETARAINGVLFDGTGDITIKAEAEGGTSSACSGNAATATKLQTPRNINGVAFDGTANITVADNTKLPLSGGTLTGALTSTHGSIYLQESGAGSRIWHNGSHQYLDAYVGNFYIRAGASGSQTTILTLSSAGALTVPNNVTAYSDIRVKDNIEVISDALEKVCRIRGVTYDRTDMDVPRQAGVIAQEVQKVLPEVVQEGENGILSVAYGNLVGLLIEAIKELKRRLESMEGVVYGVAE